MKVFLEPNHSSRSTSPALLSGSGAHTSEDNFCPQYFSYFPLKLTQSAVNLVLLLLPQAHVLVSAILTCLLSAALPRCLLVPHIH